MMKNKRNYMAESIVGYQYNGSLIGAISGLFKLHQRDYAGREFNFSVYDTSDVPDGARVFTSDTGEKLWELATWDGRKKGIVPLLFRVMNQEGAEFAFGENPEHMIVSEEYFAQVRNRLRPHVVMRAIPGARPGQQAAFEVARFEMLTEAEKFLSAQNPKIDAAALERGDYSIESHEEPFDVMATIDPDMAE